MTSIPGKTVLITGGAGGIGYQLARRMILLGARVVLWDIDTDRLTKAVDELRSSTACDVYAYSCDVSDRRAVYAAASRVTEDIGPVHILVNNAGVVTGHDFLDCTDEQIERTFGINAMGLFWTVKTFLPDMVAAGSGHLVTVASAAGMVGVRRMADYAASKWAAIGFDEVLRMELRALAPGVKTTVVCPYFVRTGMFPGVRSRFPRLLPILESDYVADRIVKAVQHNKRRVVMPWIVNFVPLGRILPVRWFDAIVSFLGLNNAMDEFVGRDVSVGE